MQKTRGDEPDVSVIVAVYNTMPYLTECLTSLVEQSIGTDRIEIVAVDDGSTDGSSKELQRFAERYPDVFTVVRQENSGGPAAPSNLALDLARGRYVFFVGADDHLGAEALERLVAAADRLGSDIVLGKMVGVGGRNGRRPVFEDPREHVTLFDSKLPWALSNTKLFRRELIERHQLRYPTDLKVFSDQPFTLEACFHAEDRIAVLADYDYYYAVKRADSGNMTYRYRRDDRLHATAAIMAVTERLVPPGPQRDAVHLRHCTWELNWTFHDGFVDAPRDEQERAVAALGPLVRRHLNDRVMRRLDPGRTLCMRLAERGQLDAIVAVLRTDPRDGGSGPATVVDGDRAYAAYPCFRDPELALPDAWFDITGAARERFAKQAFTPAVLRWGDTHLEIETRSTLPDLAAFGTGAVRAETALKRPGGQRLRSYDAEVSADDGDPRGCVARLRLPLEDLFPAKEAPWHEWEVRLVAQALGVRKAIPLGPPRDTVPGPRRHRLRPYRIAARAADGAALVTVEPLPVRQLLRTRD
ncbi:glycosyltransferase family 2 protein [Streptomyces sp. SID14478]|uniref:glycosyltransferase family 2 protein n=1 Tax=Streptomyces sp. SID14478 TaxID=2706073 RepID=UPI0013DE8BE1|nr:glycosyltransferase family 2 protein [Streptomyces sp. SID14478]NEB81020.1 glycosyltransferase family 2 protein [Streptomyces sp. SID14478]